MPGYQVKTETLAVGGVGVSYQTKDNITLAPIRLGVGLRTGASVGYLHYRPKKSYNPL